MRRFALLLASLSLLVAPPALAEDAAASAPAAETQGWLHVRVTDAQGEESANVNVPVSLVTLVLQMGDVQAQLDRGLAERKLTLADVRQTWKALQSAGDADLVVTEDADETVRVRVEDGSLHVRVSDRGTGALRTDASIPGRVVEALLGGSGDRLDIGGAIRRLADEGAGDLIVARDGGKQLRVWVD